MSGMRILGLDFGTKRIGVAMSDELLLTAQGRDTIQRKELKSDLAFIKGIVDSDNVIEVIIGLPLNMNGTYSEKTKETVLFVSELEKVVSVPVKTWDERLTSMQADKAMLEGDMSRAKRRKLSDRLAAQIILQSYLDSRKRDQY
jgi:putative holliday junction resolvase